MSLPSDDDDVALYNDPAVVAVAEGKTSRKPDAGDFDTNSDTRITQYFLGKLEGYRPEPQIKNIIKPVVAIWARDYPKYHGKQLGNNCTGRSSIGGLIVAIGLNPKISMGKVTYMLHRCLKENRPKEKLCEELAQYFEEQTLKLQPPNATAPLYNHNNNKPKRKQPAPPLLPTLPLLLLSTQTTTPLTKTPAITPQSKNTSLASTLLTLSPSTSAALKKAKTPVIPLKSSPIFQWMTFLLSPF
jgi:hypothetical protein